MSRPLRIAYAARRLGLLLLAVLVTIAVFDSAHAGRSAAGSDPLAGSQGTDTALAATDSAVTVAGHGQYAAMKVTVNQTKGLVNQAVSVSWTGSAPTFSNPGTGAFSGTYNGNFVQIFQCWGDADPTDPLNSVDPGPPPSQCEFGGESNAPTSAYPIQDVGFEYSRVLTQPSWGQTGITGYVDPGTGFTIEPFTSVDGTVVDQQADYNAAADPLHPKGFWQNPYYSFNTTNEIDFARTYPDATNTGHGQQLFQVDTGLEAPGLGCGQSLQPLPDGSKKVPSCWLVVVPRGTPTAENPPSVTGVNSVVTSPLTPAAWANRISIPLSFQPVDTACALGQEERRIVGSELAIAAITSWQPALCAQPGAPPYNYSFLSDDRARQNLTQSAYGGAGLSVFSDPVDPSQLDPSNPVVYAPLTLSGAAIGFNIERTPQLESNGQPQPDELEIAGERITHIYLTPRLVAKLLTESYQAQLEEVTASKRSAYAWIQHNPASLVTDPDFLQWNPEFALLSTQQQLDAGDLVVEQGTSDAATTVWKWILADPEAAAWLAGKPDPWGMVVNPIYSTTASANPTGTAFGSPTPNNYPKSDPYCIDTGAVVNSPPQPARALCVLDWSPYSLTMLSAAQAAASANDGGRTTLNIAGTTDTAWSANGPQKPGTHFILSITDTASADRYGLQTASLSRSGDDGTSRSFTEPDSAGLSAGLMAMTVDQASGVLLPNPSTSVAGAYPLTMLTYAAAEPTTLDAQSRKDYAALITYAVGDGQTPGLNLGQLPLGYVPLPASLRSQALSAVAEILNPPTPPTAASTGDTSTAGPGGAASTTGSTAGSTAGQARLVDGLGEASGSATVPAGGDAAPGTHPAGDGTVRHAPTRPAALVTRANHPGLLRWVLPAGLLSSFVFVGALPLMSPGGRRGLRHLAALRSPLPRPAATTDPTTPDTQGRPRRPRSPNGFDPW